MIPRSCWIHCGWERLSVFSKVSSLPSQSRQVTGTMSIEDLVRRPQGHNFSITKTLNKRLSTRYCWRIYVEQVGNHHGQKTTRKWGVDCNWNKWTFDSGSLVYKKRRRRYEETAWKWRKIETSLVIVIFTLRVRTYVVSIKLFWNINCVVRFVSHEVWSDKGFIIWHFLHYYFSQIMLLWSLNIWNWMFFNNNESID